jgi:integrase
MAYYPDSPVSRPSRRVQAALEAIGMETRNTDGTSKREGSHTLRRSGARALFDQLTLDGGYDHPLRIVQSMLHHASITQTEVYIGVTADKRTRDEIIRGKPMYTVNSDNVVRLTV